MEIKLKPIGTVANEVKEPRRGGWEEVTSEIVVDEELAGHLEDLEGFSHIIVVYWMHKSPSDVLPPTKVHPRGCADLPLVGLFATRAPIRPNPLGVSVVRLVRRIGNILTVEGLDAIDGTPILDIKPYMPHNDSPPDARVPQWVNRLR